MKRKVSVIIPAYNAEKFLAFAVNSVLSQTMENFELIIVDDGSVDNTREIALKFSENDMRVKCYSIENRGRAGARNFGCRQADGEWLAFLDADDCWADNKLERQLESVQDEVGLIYTERTWVDENGDILENQPEKYELPQGYIYEKLIDGNYICTSSVILKRDLFLTVGGFDESPNYKNCQDYDLWIRISPLAKFVSLRETLCFYRLHDDNAHKNFYSRYIGLRSCMDRLREVGQNYNLINDGFLNRIDLREAKICESFSKVLFKSKRYDIVVDALGYAKSKMKISFKKQIIYVFSLLMKSVYKNEQ